MDIRYDRYSLIIDGRREFIRSGAMHYFRLPSQDLWRDRLFKLKAAGYNTVDLYFCWNYHSPAQGVYDFTGIRDVRKLLHITQELGLYVIARPGPYINAEYSGGGFPGWMLANKDLPLRNRREGAFVWSDEYMDYVREWWEQIIPIINEAPNIILVQIENEYATLEMEPDYMRALYNMTREMGVKVPLFHNDLYVAGLYEDIVDIYSFDNYSVTQFETDWREMPEIFQVLDNVENNLRPFCENRPLMAAELQAGWYGTWKGYKYEKITELLGREHIGISTKSLLGQGLTIYNHYKAIGGTNWGYTGSIETYTSYDFGAPISEVGINTERLFEAKATNYFLDSFDFAMTERQESFPLPLSHPESLYAVRSNPDYPDSCWLFLRNLSYEPKMLTVGNQYPVEVKPFEVIILPYRNPLQCGYELSFCTTEPLYQNAKTLVLKANRLVTLTLRADESTPVFMNDADEIELLDSSQGSVTFQCSELPEDALRLVRFGELNIILLGQRLVDTFWVQEDGVMVAGPEVRLPDGDYGVTENTRQIHVIAPDGDTIECVEVSRWAEANPPELFEWRVFDDAPELTESAHRLSGAFKPVINDAPDFDANGLYEGAAWYRLPLGKHRPKSVEVDARHIWAAFLNGQFIGEGHQLVLINGLEPPPPTTMPLPEDVWKPGSDNEILVFVSGLGHPKGFHDDAQTPQGLLTLNVDGQDQTRNARIAEDFYSRRPERIELNGRLESFAHSPIVRLQSEFSLPADPHAIIPWGLKLQAMDYERINIYLNGSLIGRYWRDCRCQEIFYLPDGLLKTDHGNTNVLELILMNFQPPIDKTRLSVQSHQVMLQPYEVFTKLRLP